MNQTTERAAALYFHPEGYTTSGPRLMGRNAAGASFLKGLFAHSTATKFLALVDDPAFGPVFEGALKRSGRKDPATIVGATTLSTLGEADAVFLPGPDLATHAFHRTQFGDNAWSLSAITHTTASARAMDSITAILTAPVQPWDALICTSRAVKANVTRILQAEAERLERRLGASKLTLPKIPVIPLGIATAEFDFPAEERAQSRSSLGLADNDIVVLFAGRLSFHAKAHPLAMYQALERAADAVPAQGRVVLIECGWHANDAIRDSFREAASFAAPSVRCVTLDGRVEAERRRAWSAADVFCSLSDNIQETFGLTPVEAMAAGLPAVVSDWDGYRDTVRDGVDGYRIPTLMPDKNLGTDLAIRHALEIDNYDLYCGYTSSFVAVDVDATTEAFSRLFASAHLRRRMGEFGRARARELFDWSVVIKQYEDLWAQLAEARRAVPAVQQRSNSAWPARLDPFDSFSSYSSRKLTPLSMVELARSDAADVLKPILQLKMVSFARVILPSEEGLLWLLRQLANQPRQADELLSGVPKEARPHLARSLVFLAKLGLVRVRDP